MSPHTHFVKAHAKSFLKGLNGFATMTLFTFCLDVSVKLFLLMYVAFLLFYDKDVIEIWLSWLFFKEPFKGYIHSLPVPHFGNDYGQKEPDAITYCSRGS